MTQEGWDPLRRPARPKLSQITPTELARRQYGDHQRLTSTLNQDLRREMVELASRNIWEEAAQAALKELGGKKLPVLEVACGSGPVLFDMYLHGGKGQMIGLDINEYNLAGAQAALDGPTFSGHRIELEPGDARDLHFEDNQFAVTIVSFLGHHLSREDLEKAMDEAVRVTIPGGLVMWGARDPIHLEDAWDDLRIIAPILGAEIAEPFYLTCPIGMAKEMLAERGELENPIEMHEEVEYGEIDINNPENPGEGWIRKRRILDSHIDALTMPGRDLPPSSFDFHQVVDDVIKKKFLNKATHREIAGGLAGVTDTISQAFILLRVPEKQTTEDNRYRRLLASLRQLFNKFVRIN